jgi:hypothetical protein
VDAFLNDCAFELGKYAEHLEERPSGRGGRVDRLLFEKEVPPGSVEFAEKADQILQRSAEPVDRPRGDDIDPAAHDLFEEPIELRPFVAAFGAADAFVAELVCDDPSPATTYRLGECLALVVDRLPIFRRDPEIEADSLLIPCYTVISRNSRFASKEIGASRYAIPQGISVWAA